MNYNRIIIVVVQRILCRYVKDKLAFQKYFYERKKTASLPFSFLIFLQLIKGDKKVLDHLGDKSITICLPSNLGSDSTLATLSRS
jgi:hypothetical protein